MHFTYCPHCGTKLIGKEIGDEGASSTKKGNADSWIVWAKPEKAVDMLREGGITWQLVKHVIENIQ